MRTLEPLERFKDFHLPRFSLFALLALLVDHFFRRSGDEVRVAEFGVDALDVGFRLCKLLIEPRFFSGQIDDALQRDRGNFTANEQLNRSIRSTIGESDLRHARKTLNDIAPTLCTRPDVVRRTN